MQAGLQFPKLSLGEASFGAAVVPGQPLLGVATGEHQGLFLTRKKGCKAKGSCADQQLWPTLWQRVM